MLIQRPLSLWERVRVRAFFCESYCKMQIADFKKEQSWQSL